MTVAMTREKSVRENFCFFANLRSEEMRKPAKAGLDHAAGVILFAVTFGP
jgi:hypothetical protein